MQLQLRYESPTDRKSKSHSFSRDPLSTREPWPNLSQSLRIKHSGGLVLSSASPETGGRSSQKTCAKGKKSAKQTRTRKNSQRFHASMKLSTIPVIGFGRPPCVATTTPEKMESAKARKRRARRGGGLDCESSAGLHSRREAQSRGCEIRSVKCREE